MINLATLGFYEDAGCTIPLQIVMFKEHSVSYLDVDGVKKLFNVVPIGEIAHTDLYIRNESSIDVAINKVSCTDPEVKLTVSSTGYLRPSNVMILHVVYSPKKQPEKGKNITGQIIINYHEIYG